MDSLKSDIPKPIKKTVTFGIVESYEGIDFPLKKIPTKRYEPLVPIIKKKSYLKQSDYPAVNSILKPAKLLELSSKSSFENYEGYLRKHLNPLSTTMNKFSQISENQCILSPSMSISPIEKSSVIKPNKRIISGDELAVTSKMRSEKLLKIPELKVIFKNISQDEDGSDETSKRNNNEKLKSKCSTSLLNDKTSSLNNIENLNLERLESIKSMESNKEKKSHTMRNLLDISDASTSTISSGSESEESWGKVSPAASDEEKKLLPTVEKDKDNFNISRHLGGKVIIREARLQLNPLSQSGLDGPFSALTSATTNYLPATVTCGVCGAVRFYRFVKQARKFGIYSCESCRKFISKMLKKEKLSQRNGPIIMHCLQGHGNCHVPPIVRSQQWKLLRCSNKARCPACWLKMCLKGFIVPPNIRASLIDMLPPNMRANLVAPGSLAQVNLSSFGCNDTTGQLDNENENNVFVPVKSPTKPSEEMEIDEENSQIKLLEAAKEIGEPACNKKRRLTRVKVKKKITNDSLILEDLRRHKMDIKGPRVKHVCRSASIVLGQPIATFPSQYEKENPILQNDDPNSIPVIAKDIAENQLLCADMKTSSGNKIPLVTAEEFVTDENSAGIQTKQSDRMMEPLVPSKPKNKTESGEDETVIDLVPKKLAMKTSTNVHDHQQKYGLNCPELICVDFWESFDPDEVCSSGFGLIGTASFTVTHICFLCGSSGREKMLMCSSCCEWYHTWCAEDAVGGTGWMCARCVACAACSRTDARLRCPGCARHFHASCLPVVPPDHRSDWPQICSTCLKCKSCDSTRVSKFVGSLPFCGPCFKLRQKGNYCPLCQACYRDNDFDSKMMECGWCGRWVHANCEGLTGEGYQLLSALPPSIEYICCKCMPHDPPWRKMITEHLKSRLLHLMKLLAKNKKACALLKLTPHKNTLVPIKSLRLILPQTIRKLHFDNVDAPMKNTTETKVYRNTARTRRSNLAPYKSFYPNVSQMWHCPSLLRSVQIEKEDMPHSSHKIVNLQEPLMQNKEICFSTGFNSIKTELGAPCIEVHDNKTAFCKSEMSMLQTTIHDDKYETISSDDEPTTTVRQPIRCTDTITEDLSRTLSPCLLNIKKRVNSDEYVSVKDFNRDMKDVIEKTSSIDLHEVYKNLFSETFPWFDCENNCLQPNLEVEGKHEESEFVTNIAMKDNKRIKTAVLSVNLPLVQRIPKLQSEAKHFDVDFLEFYSVPDSRTCLLCKTIGDGLPCLEGRLLYCGQNDWIHANCALWSAEVYEEIDGSLQNVHSAISRGKLIKCASCELKGASVGCCAKNCSETYHYACARNKDCAFLDDKRVFCPSHVKDIPLKSLQKDADFELTRPVYVELDRKKKRYNEIGKVQFLLGALTVHNLGKIVSSVSDFEEFLMPVDFVCSRLFWSSKIPSKIVKYTIKTKLILSEPTPGFDFGVNITIDHSMDIRSVDRLMAEVKSWHKNLGSVPCKNTLLLRTKKSTRKSANSVSLEEFAVRQVVEYLLDSVCKQETQDEEEPQTTADLLPPELKDAIFEDLNHDLLDGISMQDIFPSPYEDLVTIDLKGEFYSVLNHSDEKSDEKTDFIDDLVNNRLESTGKERKKPKSEFPLQSQPLKTFTTGRNIQRTSCLTWNNKFDPALLSSTIKRSKITRSYTVSEKLSSVKNSTSSDNCPDGMKSVDNKLTSLETDIICGENAHTSITFRTTSPKEKDDTGNGKTPKSESYYTDVIDFYTNIQCSPISQLDGASDWSAYESTCSARMNSPGYNQSNYAPIQQLDGAEENADPENNKIDESAKFLFKANELESTHTVTIAGNFISRQPEMGMTSMDKTSATQNHVEQPVQCDRCQCTYRNKESYDRHIPSCDMMSTSESEGENPKSPENKTLTTLQNALQGAFAQSMVIPTVVSSGIKTCKKLETVNEKRTSMNTRQITINGTIVETASIGPSKEMTVTITEQIKSGTVLFDHNKSTNVQVSAGQQFSPHIVVTPQLFIPPKNSSSSSGQKNMTSQMISQPGILPYNICVKTGNGNTAQQLQGGPDMTHLLNSSGGIQVITSNSNQVLTVQSNETKNFTPMIHGTNQVKSFPNLASALLPVNSIQDMPSASVIQNIPMIRSHIQGGPTIVMPTMTAQKLTSANSQHKPESILPNVPQKSPKKPSVHPKPILQPANRGKSRPTPKSAAIKRQNKAEKIFTAMNQSSLGTGNTVIQLQSNNQTSSQPSIIVQPIPSHNLISAYVEALSQQQNPNVQYIATITPQGNFKASPQYISQAGLVPQTFQIQQIESGELVAVPSGGIPILLPQSNVGILPPTIQQGATVLSQGTLQQGILSQGATCSTILPQAIHTQNGTTIISQGALHGLTHGNITPQTATLLSSNALRTAGTTILPQRRIVNGQTSIIPNNALGSQANTLISSAHGTTMLPQGTLLPQFCNDQVILGSTPTLEMVTDSSGCMYLTTTQPVYYGLETIVQNTVMSSQQFVSTAMQGVLAQNSSFSATTTQVFQASKIEPIVEVSTGYVVVNNVGESVTGQNSMPTVVTAHSMHPSPHSTKISTSAIPSLTLKPLQNKSSNSNNHRQSLKVQLDSGTMPQASVVSNPVTSHIHNMTMLNASQNVQVSNMSKAHYVSIAPSLPLVSSMEQPMVAISQTLPSSGSPFTLQSIPISQAIVSNAVIPLMSKPSNIKVENVLEICSSEQKKNNYCMPTISVTQSIKSPIPWRQMHPPNSNTNIKTAIETQNITSESSAFITTPINIQNNISMRSNLENELEKSKQNLLSVTNNNQINGVSLLSHQFETSKCVSHHSPAHSIPNNVIQINDGNISPSLCMHSNFDVDTSLKLSKTHALSETKGSQLNLVQKLIAPFSQPSANEDSFHTMGTLDNRHETISNQINLLKLSNCQVSGSVGNKSANYVPHCTIRPQVQSCQNFMAGTSNRLPSIANKSTQMQMSNAIVTSLQDMSYQEVSNNGESITVSNNIQQNRQREPTTFSMSSNNNFHGNVQIKSHESTSHSTPNQIPTICGEIQHCRQSENNNQLQHMNQSNVMFHHDSQTNLLSIRNISPDNSNLMNINSFRSNHNLNQEIDISHMHMQQSMPDKNSTQNNRMMLDSIQSHTVTNMHHQINSNRSMDNIQRGPSHDHFSNGISAQMDDNMRLNQRIAMQEESQIESDDYYNKHQMSSVRQTQNSCPQDDNNVTGLLEQVDCQVHNRTQIDNSMHICHLSSTSTDKIGSMFGNSMYGNRHQNISMNMQDAISQLENYNNSMDSDPPHLPKQINSIKLQNNIAFPNNCKPFTNRLMGLPNMKGDIQNSCDISYSNNNTRYINNQNVFDMFTNLNTNLSNMKRGDITNSKNVNNTNMHTDTMYDSNSQNSMAGHNMIMNCTNASEHSVLTGNLNHRIMNTQSHVNTNQRISSALSNAAKINNNSYNLNCNSSSSQFLIANDVNNKNNIFTDECFKSPSESSRNKNIIESKMNLPVINIQNRVCSEVNILRTGNQSNAISFSDQIGYLKLNPQSNRVVKIPERDRLNDADLENNINQHSRPQHNIRVVTNSSNNVHEPMSFVKKPDSGSAMINVPFQSIPNSTPMNVNVNSGNNTVNITVQNNLGNNNIASKDTLEISIPLRIGYNLLQNHCSTASMICIPAQNTINLPTQNSSSITLPKAPPTQQSGIPTNVVNPMSMRPMNRVLPLHRDNHQKPKKSPTILNKAVAAPRPSQIAQDMPDLNIRDTIIDTDLNKAIAESKQIMALKINGRSNEDGDVSGIESSSEIHLCNTGNGLAKTKSVKSELDPLTTFRMLPLPSLPSLDAEEIEIERPKILIEEKPNRITAKPNTYSTHTKVKKRAHANNKNDADQIATNQASKTASTQENLPISSKKTAEAPKDDAPKLIYEVTSEDGFNYTSPSLTDLWAKVLEAVQNAREQSGIPRIQYNLPSSMSGAHILGIKNNALRYLIEQLPGASRCTKYKSRLKHSLRCWDNNLDLSEGFKQSLWGSARTGPIARKQNYDMFSWMASPFREDPKPCSGHENDSSISRRLVTLPPAMRFRHLKETSKASVGVYRSHIHGRGLFCKRDIEEGDMVIEYSGEVIRAVLADQREKKYEAMSGRRGVGGCYMFRIDDHLVVDATLKGNAARFINHSCDPNCYSRVVDIHGHKHILIFALRRITVGEELTYDYKFPFEDVKIPCTCGAKKCRKYLN